MNTTTFATVRGRALALALATAALTLLALAPAAQAGKIVDRIVAGQPFSGSLGAMFNQPRGLAVKHNGNGPADAGDVYVADYGNHRIQQFDSSGNFIRAFGQDTIAATVNEQQLVRVTATAGTYTLSFDGATTAPIPFNANGPQIDDALDLLSTIDGDANVTVSGSVGTGFTVTFTGKFAAVDQPQMTADDSQLNGTVSIESLADGTATTADTGTGIESCEVAQHCKAGATTSQAGGAFNLPSGVAIDQTNGHLFVKDRENGRVQEFEADGAFVKAWGWGVATGAAAFEVCTVQATCLAGRRDQAEGNGNGGQIPRDTALNNDAGTGIVVVPAGPANAGNVIVADGTNRRVQEFNPSVPGAAVFVRLWGWDVVATGQPGNIDDDSFEICSSTLVGVCKRSGGSGSDATREVGRFHASTTGGYPRHVAVDGDGVVFAVNIGLSSSWRVDSFDTSQSTPALLPKAAFSVFQVVGSPNTTASASLDVDPVTGNLLIARNGEAIRVAEIADPSSESASLTDTHYLNSGLSGSGIALDSDSGDLYMTASSRIFAADAGGAPPALMQIDPPSAVGSRTATLNGKVNPDGLFATSWRLQYSLDGVGWSDAGSGLVPAGTTDVPVSAVATGLRPNSLYQTRLATNQEFGNPEFTSAGLDFTTDPEPPEIAATRADSIADTSARLTARVNPHNSETTFHFKWGEGDFANTIPVPDAPLGAGPAFLFASQQLSGLEPNTTYQFKAVATNLAVGTSEGPTRTFTTSAVAPGDDTRAFELVSPADKSGAVGLGWWYNGPGATALAGIAAYHGERFAANSHNGGTLEGDAGFAYANDVALAERVSGAVGWQSHSAVSNPAWGTQIFRASVPRRGASDDLSLLAWETNGGLLKPFPELTGWSAGVSAGQVNSPLFLGDWQGRWEIFGPNSPEPWHPFPPYPQQVEVGTDSEPGGGDKGTAIAAEGDYAAVTTSIRGMAGPGDPSQDLVARPARTTYLDDLSAGVSNSFPGDGVRSLVGVCTAGIRLPARTEISPGVFGLAERDCPAKGPNRDAALISDRGATIQFASGQGTSMVNPTRGIVSADGRRIFFMSPDPAAAGVPSAGCTGTAATSICPPQLYVRQRNADGSVVTRWLSKPVASMLGAQDATLAAPAIFEGASRDGSRVFFRTTAPLTPDDPNGQPLTPTDPRPILSGTPNSNSWDLYMFELAPGDDPTGAGSSLTRISRGPDADGDCNAPLDGTDSIGGLRFAAADGRRAYFTCAAPLPGVAAPADPNRTTAPDGTPTTTDAANLYLFEDADGSAAWRFVARLPRGTEAAACATTSFGSDGALSNSTGTGNANNVGFVDGKCVHGNSTGDFITLWTPGALTVDDPEAGSMDIYAYDAAAEELIRVTASQGGADTGYMCGLDPGNSASTTLCHGDPGYQFFKSLPFLGVATDPPNPADRIAFFQSRSQLLPEDTDDAFDVYQWKNGALSLLSTGQSDTDGAFYKGNDRTGKNVYMVTMDRLTWQDIDAVLDAYTARIGGGVDEPILPPACAVLADACQGAAASPPTPSHASSGAIEGPGNVTEKGGRPAPDRCAKQARNAQRTSSNAKRFRRAARKASGRRARALKRRARKAARNATRTSAAAKRCRARANRRAGK